MPEDGRNFGNHLILAGGVCRFRSRGNKFMAYAALVRQLFNRFPRTSVERGMWTSQPCCSRWHIAAGQSRIDAMDRRCERRDYRNRKHSCIDRQSHMRTPPVAPVGIVVHGQHLLEHESTQPLGAGSLPPPSFPTLFSLPSRAARVAEFSRKQIHAAGASHNTFAPAPSRSNHRTDNPHRHRARRSRTR